MARWRPHFSAHSRIYPEFSRFSSLAQRPFISHPQYQSTWEGSGYERERCIFEVHDREAAIHLPSSVVVGITP